MKLVGVVKFHNEEQHLEGCLKSLKEFCDEICCYNADSTDTSKDIALRYTDKILTGPNDFDKEAGHRQKLLNMATYEKADWIFWLDADEVIEKGGGKDIRKLCERGAIRDTESWVFPQINLWRSIYWMRIDNKFGEGWFNRLWKNNHQRYYIVQKGLHQTPQPQGLRSSLFCDVKIIHLGFNSFEKIVNKIKMYQKWGMKKEEFERFYNESKLRLEAINPVWYETKPEERPKPMEVEEWLKYL